MKDFFISHRGSDTKWAGWIAYALKEEGYEVILDAWDFRPGGNIPLQMDRALRECERTIAVLSPDYFTSGYTQAEWAATFWQDPEGLEGRLVPVVIEKTELRGLLGSIHFIDLTDVDEATARRRLVCGVKGESVWPDSSPEFPGRSEDRPPFPGLPPHWNVPHNRNPNFTGRGDLLTALHEQLNSGEATAVTQAIKGLGGVGKTQLAVEYAYRHRDDYEIVWWVRSEEPAKLAADYAGLAEHLGIEQEQDQKKVIAAVRQALQQRGRWLLVFDNVPEPKDVKGYIPQGGSGHVIVTSLYQAWGGVAKPLSVEVFERPQSVEFLCKRTGQCDSDSADAVAQACGDLPLALECAGAYIEKAGLSLSEYVTRFEEHESELLQNAQPSDDYEYPVGKCFDLSIEQLEGESDAAVQLLNLCAFVAPDDIPLEVIRDGTEFVPEPLASVVTDGMSLDGPIAALLRYSLVERDADKDALSVHRLVQAVVRDRLSEEGKKTWAAAAVRIVSKAFPYDSDDVTTWDDCSRLLPHALASAGHAEKLKVAAKASARVIAQAGTYLWGRAQFSEARTAFERALPLAESGYGNETPEVASIINNLGSVLEDMGDLKSAKANYERAQVIDEKAFGPDHPKVAIRLNNLGSVLWAMGDLEGAKANYERALEIDEKAYGPDHPEVATDLNNLGTLLEDKGDLEGAEANYERALEIGEKALGPDHPSVAMRLHNLGGLLAKTGEVQKGHACLRRALRIFQEFLGDEHPKTQTVRRGLERIEAKMRERGIEPEGKDD